MKPTRTFGLLEATALNMSNMVGVGPFLVIPLLIGSMGGPQAMLGWLAGAVVAICDGLVWAELAAAMPEEGGTFLYLRRAFLGTPYGRLLPFLFVWQFLFSGPLEIASGYIGFAQYLTYFWSGAGFWTTRLIACGAGVLAIALLYRRIQFIARVTVVLWIGMLATVAVILVSGFLHFNPRIAFDFPAGAFQLSPRFFMGLGGATMIAMYSYLGYYDICFVGGEVRSPERVIPRSILYSIVAVALIYAGMTLSIVGVVPWREVSQSRFIASHFMEVLYGRWAGATITLMILWTAFASVFALLLGYSRVPYAAAQDGYFFRSFGSLHPTKGFPHVSLLVIGVVSVLCGLLNLDWVLSALFTARILAQFLAQIVALDYVRRRADLVLPFRMWLYPVPAAIAALGWIYIFVTSGVGFAIFGVAVLLAGIVVYRLTLARAQAAL